MICLSDNGSKLKNNQMNTVLAQSGIKQIYPNPYRPRGNSHIEIIHNFLKRTLTEFLSSSDAEWDKILPFACYCFNATPPLMTWRVHSSLYMVETCLKVALDYLGKMISGIYAMTRD